MPPEFVGDHRLIEPGFVRFAARVAYDGSKFNGFQVQRSPKEGARTIQGDLETVLEIVFQRRTKIAAASRTDANVHSRGQGVHFDAPERWASDPSRLEYSLNQLLPSDMLIWNVTRSPTVGAHQKLYPGLPWHANIAAIGKMYSYRFHVGKHIDPLCRLYRAHWYDGPLDLDLIEASIPCFVGERDFAAFGNRIGHQQVGPDTNRKITRITLVREGGDNYRLDFELDGALYKMVRNIVGLMFLIGKGEVMIDYIPAIFSSRDRNFNPAKAAPPQGLTLEHVFYDDY